MLRKWPDRIIGGDKPSDLLNEALQEQPDLSGGELAAIFEGEFPGIFRHARVFVSRWKRPGSTSTHGVSTDYLDRYLLELIEEWRS